MSQELIESRRDGGDASHLNAENSITIPHENRPIARRVAHGFLSSAGKTILHVTQWPAEVAADRQSRGRVDDSLRGLND